MFSSRFEEVKHFILRGLCKRLEKLMDVEYVVDMGTAGQKGIIFSGQTKTKIVLDINSNRWSVVSIKDESVIMELVLEVYNRQVN